MRKRPPSPILRRTSLAILFLNSLGRIYVVGMGFVHINACYPLWTTLGIAASSCTLGTDRLDARNYYRATRFKPSPAEKLIFNLLSDQTSSGCLGELGQQKPLSDRPFHRVNYLSAASKTLAIRFSNRRAWKGSRPFEQVHLNLLIRMIGEERTEGGCFCVSL